MIVRYADHNGTATTTPTNFTVAIKLYEGTSREVTYNYAGTLSAANSGNANPPTSTGADWADVATITPTLNGAPKIALGKMASIGMPRITVAIPSEAVSRSMKQAAEK